MTTFPNAPRLLKGGLVLVDAGSGNIQRVIVLQYNPETLTRTLQGQAGAGEGQGRSQALRIQSPPVETIKLDAEIDATDQLEFPDLNPTAVEAGIHPQLAALETIVYPPSERLSSNNTLANLGTLEIVPVESALTLFVWSQKRVVPVRVTDFSITEEAFDTKLNPTRAKVGLGLRVLSVDDLGFSHRGGNIFMAYLQAKEQLARETRVAGLAELGLGKAAVSGPLDDLLRGPATELTLYPPSSRYHGLQTTELLLADGRSVRYLRRRFLPDPSTFGTLVEHDVADGDRLDNIAAQYFNDPLASWRIADANRVLRMELLTSEVGRRLRITLPGGVLEAPDA